jgi:hypothetical protein
MAAGLRIRGKSGLHEATVPGNARPGQPEGKRHREQSARHVRVRVKRWGKSPPRDGQPDRHGKPHREQCRIGTSRRLIPPGISRQGRFSPRGPGWQLEPAGNGGPRGMVIPSRKGRTESGLQAVRAVLSPKTQCHARQAPHRAMATRWRARDANSRSGSNITPTWSSRKNRTGKARTAWRWATSTIPCRSSNRTSGG